MGARYDLGHQSAIALFLAVCAQLTVMAFLARPEDDGQHLVQRVFFVSVFAFLLAWPLISGSSIRSLVLIDDLFFGRRRSFSLRCGTGLVFFGETSGLGKMIRCRTHRLQRASGLPAPQ